MAKKDKFVYSTDYLANVHASASEPTTEAVKEELPVNVAWDEKGLIKAKKTGKKGKK